MLQLQLDESPSCGMPGESLPRHMPVIDQPEVDLASPQYSHGNDKWMDTDRAWDENSNQLH